MHMRVKLIATVKLVVDTAEKNRLLSTMERVNEASNWLAGKAFEARCADKFRLQKEFYREMRETFGIPAQHAVRAISKVCEAYKRDKTVRPTFKKHSAIAFDQRLYTFKNGLDRLSLMAVDGRLVVSCVHGEYHRARLEGVRGQADLVYRKGKLYLFVTVDVPDGTTFDRKGVLGVDLGIRNLAVDSDGESFSGAGVEACRVRNATLRGALQSRGTKSAKRHLKRLSGREARFRADTNHVISKRLVRKAQDTERSIALEDLTGIRDRVTVWKPQRARHMGWAFAQLRAFVSYKARLAGVRVDVVDPRNTSRTCLDCGHCDKRNRKSQAEFVCIKCGFTDNADHVGAVNIARRAQVEAPIVSVVDMGNRLQADTSLRSGTSLNPSSV